MAKPTPVHQNLCILFFLGTQLDQISWPLLRLGMAMWLTFRQWNGSRSTRAIWVKALRKMLSLLHTPCSSFCQLTAEAMRPQGLAEAGLCIATGTKPNQTKPNPYTPGTFVFTLYVRKTSTSLSYATELRELIYHSCYHYHT